MAYNSHRGRVQAQGRGINKSVKWDRTNPPTAKEVLKMLDDLWQQLTLVERKEREEGFRQARRFVVAAAAASGVDAVVIVSFPKPKLKGGIRVDIEVRTGRACIPD